MTTIPEAEATMAEQIERALESLLGGAHTPSIVVGRDRRDMAQHIAGAMSRPAPTPADLESTILDWPCEAQFQLATRIAANVGYVLAPEPLIDRPAPAAEVTGEREKAAIAAVYKLISKPSYSLPMDQAREIARAVQNALATGGGGS